jgi:WD40 repeat protein
MTYANGNIHTWDLAIGRLVDTITTGNPYVSAYYAGDLGIVGTDENVYFYDVSSERAFAGRPAVEDPATDRLNFRNHLVDSTGQYLAVNHGYKDSVSLIDLNRQTILASLVGHSDNISSMVFGPNSETLITGSEDGTVRIWPIWDVTEDSVTFLDLVSTEALRVRGLRADECSFLELNFSISCQN